MTSDEGRVLQARPIMARCEEIKSSPQIQIGVPFHVVQSENSSQPLSALNVKDGRVSSGVLVVCSMVRRFPKIGIYSLLRAPTLPRKQHHFAARTLCAVTLPLSEITNIWASGSSPRHIVRRRKYDDLMDSLSRDQANPSRVWSHYKDLLMFLGHEQLPLDIHQAVLRKCTPSCPELRVSAARRVFAANTPKSPHLHEGRFRMIISNIRVAGWTPSLDDYHFILEQFAAVGHHTGSMHVYTELSFLGLEPKAKTFGLCLQAIAHRLSLPCSEFRRPLLVREAIKMLDELFAAMSTNSIPFTSVNLDLAIRILKDSSDRDAFEAVLKQGYGIDLAYLDRAPLDMTDEMKLPAARLPFSTDALNTTIDMLGRLGNISKLVQAFEVLTQPLPPEASLHFSSSFDDDDDFGPSIAPPSAQKYQYPHATPNTTTYNLLIKYLAKAGHATFSRHYLKHALYMDHLTDRALRSKIIRGQPLEEIPAPHFAINRGTLLPVFGQANRDKNVALMRRVLRYTRKARRRKKQNIGFYSDIQRKLQPQSSSDGEERELEESSSIPVPPFTISSIDDHRGASLSSIPEPPCPPPGDQCPHSPKISAPPASSTSDDSTRLPWQTTKVTSKQRLSVFDVDLDAQSAPRPVKYFNLDLHLVVLSRDLEDIEVFYRHFRIVYARTVQRVKERLGRRVWNGKNIWLRTNDGGGREVVSRLDWRKIVRFRVSNLQSSAPDRTVFGIDATSRLDVAPGSIAGRRGFATVAIRRRELRACHT